MSGIAKQVARRRLNAPDDSLAYWRSRPVAERLAQVQVLRAEYHGWDDAAGPRLQRIHQCCAARDVRFLIVGGYAVAAHGHPRFTKDLDVWLWLDPGNADRLVAALGDFGFGSLGLSADDFAEPGTVVQLGYPPKRIDLLTSIDGVDFDECFAKRMIVEVDGLDVPFIDVEPRRQQEGVRPTPGHRRRRSARSRLTSRQ
jgi:hypothetical protein